MTSVLCHDPSLHPCQTTLAPGKEGTGIKRPGQGRLLTEGSLESRHEELGENCQEVLARSRPTSVVLALEEKVLEALAEEVSQQLLARTERAALDSWLLNSCLHAARRPTAAHMEQHASSIKKGTMLARPPWPVFQKAAVQGHQLSKAPLLFSAAHATDNSPLASSTWSETSTEPVCSVVLSDDSSDGGSGSPWHLANAPCSVTGQQKGKGITPGRLGPEWEPRTKGGTSKGMAADRAPITHPTVAPNGEQCAMEGMPAAGVAEGSHGGSAGGGKLEGMRYLASALNFSWSVAALAAETAALVAAETLALFEDDEWDACSEDELSPPVQEGDGGLTVHEKAELMEDSKTGGITWGWYRCLAQSPAVQAVGKTIESWSASIKRRNEKLLKIFLDRSNRHLPLANRIKTTQEPSDKSLWKRRGLCEPKPLKLSGRRQVMM